MADIGSETDNPASQHIGTWHWDIVQGRITVDQTTAELLGLTQGEADRGVGPRRIVRSVHPKDRKALSRSVVTPRQAGASVKLVLHVMPAREVVRRVEVRGWYGPDEHGTPVRGYGIVIGLTDEPYETPARAEPVPIADPGDPLRRSAALFRSMRRTFADHGTFRLRTLLDMTIIELEQIMRRRAK